jgi:hypothetical protein
MTDQGFGRRVPLTLAQLFGFIGSVVRRPSIQHRFAGRREAAIDRLLFHGLSNDCGISMETRVSTRHQLFALMALIWAAVISAPPLPASLIVAAHADTLPTVVTIPHWKVGNKGVQWAEIEFDDLAPPYPCYGC